MKNKILLFLIFILAQIGLFFHLQEKYDEEKNKVLNINQYIIENQYTTIIDSLTQLADTSFEGFVNDNELIKKTFYKQDRKKLYQLMKDTYNYLTKLGFKQVHFHLPNNISFLRMHKPDKYGDDLTNIRYSVKYTNDKKEKSVGVEAGRVLPGFRFVYPVFFQNKHIGSVEFSFGIDKVVSSIEKSYSIHTHFLIDQKLFNKKVFDEYKNYYTQSKEHQNYYKLKRDICKAEAKLFKYNNQFLQDISHQLKTANLFTLEMEVFPNSDGHTHRAVTFYPLENIEKNETFYFVFYHDSKDLLALEDSFINELILYGILISTIFLILFILILKKDLTEKSQQKFRSLLKNASDGIHILDFDGRLIECSDSFSRMLGYSKDELLQMSMDNWDKKFTSQEALVKVIHDLIEHPHSFETQHIKKDGSIINVQINAKGIIIDEKQYLYASSRDITELKIKDKIIIEQSKMASMGEMIGNIAHQWRQPLSAISVSATSLLYKKELNLLSDDEFIKSLETINDQSQHLSKTIDTFKNYLKGDKELIDTTVQHEINNLKSIIEASLKNNYIDLIIEQPKDPIYIKLPNGELEEVLINIINNAKDILKSKNIENPWIKLSIDSSDSIVFISIEDNGGGIPQSLLPRIFDPYFTTKHQSQGTGLGLYMSYQIVTESIGGKLYAKNTKNGAKFTIEIAL